MFQAIASAPGSRGLACGTSSWGYASITHTGRWGTIAITVLVFLGVPPGPLRWRPRRGPLRRIGACGHGQPAVTEVMAELGLDLSKQFPKLLTTEAVRASDVVITMDCGRVRALLTELLPGEPVPTLAATARDR